MKGHSLICSECFETPQLQARDDDKKEKGSSEMF